MDNELSTEMSHVMNEEREVLEASSASPERSGVEAVPLHSFALQSSLGMVLKAVTPYLNSNERDSLPDGKDYMDCDGSSSFYEVFSNSFEDSTNVTPIFFILSPGADPV